MPLFFNNRFNNMQKPYVNNRFNNVQNPYIDNRFNNVQNPYINNGFNQNNQPSDITLKPLTQEELDKINEEIQQNIEKNKQNVTNINLKENNLEILNYIEDFIQDEANSHIFYKNLIKKCENNKVCEKIENISNDCLSQCLALKDYYKNFKNESFEEKPLNINMNIPFKPSLLLAIEEEIKSYDKLCKAIDILPIKDTNIFYQIALRKLSRINSLQYISINESF